MTIEIPLSRGMVALIDDEDLPLVAGIPWYAAGGYGNRTWYAVADEQLGWLHMHRRLLGLERGDPRRPDHRDGNGLNNRRANLRLATPAQNSQNRRGYGSSGFKGVVLYKRHGRSICWRARIGSPCKALGQFGTPEDAARAYDAEARRRYGEFACVNFPSPGERSALTGEIMPLLSVAA